MMTVGGWGAVKRNYLIKLAFVPLFSTTAVFLVLSVSFGISDLYLFDLFACYYFGFALFAVTKDNLFYVVNLFFLLFVLYAINQIKLHFFGEPVIAADILSLIALYDIQSGVVKFTAIAVIVVAVLLLTLNLKMRLFSLIAFLLFFVVVPSAYVYAFSRNICTGVPICSGELYYGRLSSMQVFSLSLIDLKKELFERPRQSEVRKAVNTVTEEGWFPLRTLNKSLVNKRNVHVVLVESLWDPLLLSQVSYNRDPFFREFRQLWESTGNSRVLSPVYGGGTANAEFELLCGLPATSSIIKFEIPFLNNNLPCLPNILNAQGYLTLASHPNINTFWNRDAAYPKLGFDEYYSIDDFNKKDMLDNRYLSDKSLYAQNGQHIATLGQPVFNYVLTVSQHYPYVDVPQKVIQVSPETGQLSRYANLVYLGTKQLYKYYTLLRKNDPESVIVMLGDHLPLLEMNGADSTYATMSGADSDADPQRIMDRYAVPLIVVNGKEGPVELGAVSMFELPAVILELLFDDQRTNTAYTQPNPAVRYRPIRNRGVLYQEESIWQFCPYGDPEPDCISRLEWVDGADVITKDIIVGDGYAFH